MVNVGGYVVIRNEVFSMVFIIVFNGWGRVFGSEVVMGGRIWVVN